MNNTKKLQQKFTLNKGNVEYVVNTYIKQDFRNYNFIIRKSEWSNSIYIDVLDKYIKEKMGKIRISDHIATPNLKPHLIKNNTRYNKVVNMIKSDLNRFGRREIKNMYEKI